MYLDTDKKPVRNLGLLFLFLLIFPTPRSMAEYRVFLLKISTPPSEPGQPEDSRMIESNLDPEQYRLYYPVYPQEKISYIDTWRCKGRTDYFQPFCRSPRATSSDQESSTTGQISAPPPPRP
jgi:hypothetical protein